MAPVNVSGTCLVNPSHDWEFAQQVHTVREMALALASGGIMFPSLPMQGIRGVGKVSWYNHNRWKFDDISQNHKHPSVSFNPEIPLVQKDICTRKCTAVYL